MGKTISKSVTLAKGVNLMANESAIDDNEVVSAKNLIPLQSGRIVKRGGMQLKNLLIANTRIPISYHRPTFNAPFDGITVTRQMYTSPANTTLWASAFNGSAAASVAVSFDFGFVSDRRVCVVSYRNKMYGFPGYGGPYQGAVIQADAASANGFTVGEFNFQGTGNQNLRPRVAVPYRNRMAYFNLGPGYESTGIMSDDFDPTTVGNSAADTRPIEVGARDGDQIIGAIEVTLSGVDSDLNTGLLVLREFSAYLLTEEPSQSTDTNISFYGDTHVNKLNVPSGCSSPDTIVQTSHGIMWAGHDDVWIFHAGSLPQRIGWKIRPVLQATPASFRYLWHAAYHDGFYRLALFSPGQTTFRAHDSMCGEQWWLDISEGAPQDAMAAQWFGPQIFVPSRVADTAPTAGNRFMATDTRPGREPELFGVELSVADTTANGGLSTVNLVAFDANTAYDSAMAVTQTAPVETGRTSVADTLDNEISTEIITKEYDLGDPSIEKLVQGVELDLFLSQPTRIAVTAVLDGGRSTKTFNEDINNTGFLGGVDPLDSSTYPLSTEYQAFTAYPSPTERNHGKRVQFKIADLPGFLIDADNVAVQINLSDSVIQAVTLTAGYYTNLMTLCDMIVARLTATGVGTFTHTVTAPPRPNTVAIAAGVLWEWRFVNPSLADNAAARNTRIIGTWLGYDTTAYGLLASTNTAGSAVPYKLSAQMGVGGILARMKPSRRRPV